MLRVKTARAFVVVLLSGVCLRVGPADTWKSTERFEGSRLQSGEAKIADTRSGTTMGQCSASRAKPSGTSGETGRDSSVPTTASSAGAPGRSWKVLHVLRKGARRFAREASHEHECRTTKVGFGLPETLHRLSPICWLLPKCENGWMPSGRTRREQIGLGARAPRGAMLIVSTVQTPTQTTACLGRDGRITSRTMDDRVVEAN